MTLGEKLIDLRKNLGISQEQLAEKLGVSRQAVSKWELNESAPNVEKVVALSRLFNVTTDYLIIDNSTEEEITPLIKSSKPQKFISKKALGIALMGHSVLWLAILKIVSLIITAKVSVYGEVISDYDFFPYITRLGLLISLIIFGVLMFSGIVILAGNTDRKIETIVVDFIHLIGKKLKEKWKLLRKKQFGDKRLEEEDVNLADS